MNDPIIDEVRRYRDEHAKKFGYDLKAICDDFRKNHAEYVDRLKHLKTNTSKIGQMNQVAESPSEYTT